MHLSRHVMSHVMGHVMSHAMSCTHAVAWQHVQVMAWQHVQVMAWQHVFVICQEKDGKFLFMGVLVCQRAFQILTGVPAGTIQQAREAMRANAVTALTRKELGMWASIRNAAMAPRYLDARAWIEVHAERYAEANPMTGQMVLPFGRKSDYYHMYCWERSQEVLHHLDGKWAAQNTFLQAWRCEP